MGGRNRAKAKDRRRARGSILLNNKRERKEGEKWEEGNIQGSMLGWYAVPAILAAMFLGCQSSDGRFNQGRQRA